MRPRGLLPIVSLALLSPLPGQALADAGVCDELLKASDSSFSDGALFAQSSSMLCARPIPFIGVCYWLLCTPYGCTEEKSIKSGTFTPDVVVSAYNALADNPWDFARRTVKAINEAGADATISPSGVAPNPCNGGQRSEMGVPGRPDQENPGHENLIFKAVDVIGHPAADMQLCPSEAQAYQPYFLSGLDSLAWRWSIPEVIYPQSVIPGVREIGTWPLNTWGAVYPRSGWVIQSEDPKAGAVTAQRAGDFVTRKGQPHVYNELASGGQFIANNKMVWRPDEPLMEGDYRTGWWQQILPLPLPHCEVFGENDTLAVRSWADAKVTSAGDYAWTLWRPYRCCEVKGDVFLGSVDIVIYPPPK